MSTTAPAIAGLLRRIALMPRGAVVFAGLDQEMDRDAWDAIGSFDADPLTGRAPAGHETHPQYALKRLLDRMSATRDDVALWRRRSEHAARAVRGRNLPNAILPPPLTSRRRDLKTPHPPLAGAETPAAPNHGKAAQAPALAQ